jgi:hypothetical protein
MWECFIFSPGEIVLLFAVSSGGSRDGGSGDGGDGGTCVGKRDACRNDDAVWLVHAIFHGHGINAAETGPAAGAPKIIAGLSGRVVFDCCNRPY